MLLVGPVVVRPLLAEWNAEQDRNRGRTGTCRSGQVALPARTKRLNDAKRRYRAFLDGLRGFTVLDLACGSGNFLY